MENGLFIMLDHEDLLHLVTVRRPALDKVQMYIDKGFGHWIDGFVDVFCWNNNVLDKLNDEELYNMYICLKYNKQLSKQLI